MDIRIGVTDNPREIALQLADDVDRDALKAQIDAALASGEGTLWLTDDKGKDVAVAAARIAYVELGPEGSNPIGFG
ncbi:MAG: DUF3107 domain-containing protein [Acidimicrobiales bacterium]|nr:DUF3107 domain-containing protein [Acidimicrobiales bacterium]